MKAQFCCLEVKTNCKVSHSRSTQWDPAEAGTLPEHTALPGVRPAVLISGRPEALIPVFSFQVQVFLLQRPTASVISNFKPHLKGDTDVNV